MRNIEDSDLEGIGGVEASELGGEKEYMINF